MKIRLALLPPLLCWALSWALSAVGPATATTKVSSGSLAIRFSPASVVLARGSSTTITVFIDQSGVRAPVRLSARSSRRGIAGSFSASSTTDASTKLRLTAPSAGPLGKVVVTVFAQVGKRTASARISVEVVTSPVAASLVPATNPLPSNTLTSTSLASTPSTTPVSVVSTVRVAVPPPFAERCRLPQTGLVGVGIGQPRNPARLPSTGTVRAKVLFVDFPDVPSDRTPQAMFSLVASAPEFFAAMSYGKFRLELEPDFTWRRMSKPSTSYSFRTYDSHRAYVSEAVQLADKDVNFAGAEMLYVLTSPSVAAFPNGPTLTPNVGGGITADGATFNNAVTSGADLPGWGYKWLNHETLHSLGLPDLYAFDNPTGVYDKIHRNVGGFSIMGLISGKSPDLFAYERFVLGWLGPDQLACNTGSQAEVTLAPLSSPGGLKAIITPISDSKAVVAEYRSASPYGSLGTAGVLAYAVDSSVQSGKGPIVVYPASDSDPYRETSLLTVGGNSSVQVDGVTVTLTGLTGQGAVVAVRK